MTRHAPYNPSARARGGILLCALLALSLGLSAWQAPASRPAPKHTTHKATKKPPPSATTQPTGKLPWWRKAVVYQVFVRSFQDSNGDGKGDLKGLLKRLDDLNDGNPKTTHDLGIDALWLLPIFRSPSYHGYDTTDYERINPDYGTRQDLKKLLQEAHRRGIRVILDFVLNHTSRKHPWFQASARGPKSPKRDWYIWRKDKLPWTQPWGRGPVWHLEGGAYYYGLFWSGMPDLNLGHPPVVKELTRIAKHWLAFGVDGYRLDAARHLFADGDGDKQSDRPATHAFWRTFRKQLKAHHPHALLAGEIWSNARAIAPYCRKDELDLAFHFPLAGAIRASVTSMTATPFWKAIRASKPYPQRCWAPFLSNHDQERIMSQLHGRKPMMRNAAFLLLSLPGTPFLYYGEEIGMTNGPSRRDEDKRTPMAWDASPHGGFSNTKPWHPLTPHQHANVQAQRKNPRSLWHLYRRMLHLRKQNPTLALGRIDPIPVEGKGHEAIVAMLRTSPSQRLLVLANLSDERTNTTLTLPSFRSFATLTQEGKPSLKRTNHTTLSASLPPYSHAILRLK